jgi:methionine-rich copper-binding protein CopC
MRHGIQTILPAMLAAAERMAVAGDAAAHARLKRANPPVGGGGSAAAVPAELQVWFTEPVEPALSSLQVVGADGAPMDLG